jgi:carbonic anhydrase
MSPNEVVKRILSGNEAFLKSNTKEFFDEHKEEQTPIITLLTCSDSRVQTSAIIPDAINQVFTIKNIGNQLMNSEGSLDYGVLHLKTPVLLILGHSDCGAIKAYSAPYNHEPHSIQRELNNLHPVFALDKVHSSLTEKMLKNINYQVKLAMEKYHERIEQGKLAIVGAYYDFADDFAQGHGKLIFININGEKQDY